ncbi:hypothetical protein [Kitasatospora sp. NBC_01539]|uniref:hypothetical protein n=1 Tax=Kitasatospora sp. NBC_01539 TaxID=2903577 RepID=UPI0038602ECB
MSTLLNLSEDGPRPEDTVLLRLPRRRTAPADGDGAGHRPDETVALRVLRPGEARPAPDETMALRVLRPGEAQPSPDETLALRVVDPQAAGPGAAQDGPPVPLPADPLDELAERLADVCARAVHPFEIAAVLESDGLTDEQAAVLYGRTDSFSIADELFARTERRHSAPPEPADPWQADPLRTLLRGLLFALPGLAYLPAAPFLRSGTAAGALALTALVGWALNQALAHRAYAWRALGARYAVGRSLLRGGLAATVLGAGAAALAGATWPVLLFATGQSLYLASATVLLVTRRAKRLMGALAPTAVAAAATLATDLPQQLALAGPALSLSLAAVFAGIEIGQRLRAGDPPPAAGVPVADSLPHGLFGLAVGALVLTASFGDPWRPAPAGGASAAVALTLSMGLAEWLLFRFRSRSVTALHTSTTAEQFRTRTDRTLLGLLAGYLVVLAALGGGAALLWTARLPGAGQLGALLLLGALLWTALLLQVFGAVWPPALICTAAAVAETTATAVHPAAAEAAGLAATGLAVAAMILITRARTGRVTAHR